MPVPFKNLIIADDDEDDIQLFQEAVEDACPSILITVATNGQKLIEILDEIPKPDVILLDLNMPIKSGRECLEEIRAIDKFADVPIVILSTSSAQADKEYCLKNGANRYLVKPQSYLELRSIVADLCNGELTILSTI